MNGSGFICALNNLDLSPQSQLVVTLGEDAQFAQIQGYIQSIQPSHDVPGNYILRLRVTEASETSSMLTTGQLISYISVSNIVTLAHNSLVDQWPSNYTGFA